MENNLTPLQKMALTKIKIVTQPESKYFIDFNKLQKYSITDLINLALEQNVIVGENADYDITDENCFII